MAKKRKTWTVIVAWEDNLPQTMTVDYSHAETAQGAVNAVLRRRRRNCEALEDALDVLVIPGRTRGMEFPKLPRQKEWSCVTGEYEYEFAAP